MAKEMNKLGDEALESVSGGREGKFTDISQCPPGTREIKNELPYNEGHHKHCPFCGSNEVQDRFLFYYDLQAVYPGQECNKCGKYWPTKQHGISD